MCSILSAADFTMTPDFLSVQEMNATMKSRGPDDTGIICDSNVCLAHNRLAVMDPDNGHQPMRINHGGRYYSIIYNGEVYNVPELKEELAQSGITLSTSCDTEAVLYSYVIYGEDCPKHLNGIFAFIIYDESEKKLFMARDRLGVKPFFYTQVGTTLLCASEVKALLADSRVKPILDSEGIWQLLFMSPVTANGSGVFKNIKELLPGECGVYDENGLKLRKYWELRAAPFTDDPDTAAEKVRFLLRDAVRRQLVSDVPLCTFLSGGLDSSAISAIASEYFKEKGETLSTYSFEYEGNKSEFKSSLFQPQGDDEFAVYTAQQIGSSHTVLTAPTKAVADCLRSAVHARDLPGQADIDSSLLYFCRRIKERHTVALSGECADEIFGGYPWFYRPEMLHRDFFPWIHDPLLRPSLFDPSFAKADEGFEYASQLYKDIKSSADCLDDDSDSMRTSRIATVLSVDCFMTSLLERKDRMSMYSALEVRVPFADHRIIEYVYNVPWEIKFEGGVEKALLRKAMTGYLPEKILYRKKSPYPKTHAKEYERLVTDMLCKRLRAKSPLSCILNEKAFRAMLLSEDETWFGQLMSKPQLIAWLLQFDLFLEDYKVIL